MYTMQDEEDAHSKPLEKYTLEDADKNSIITVNSSFIVCQLSPDSSKTYCP